MRTPLGIAVALLCSGGAFAQYHGNIQPYVSGGYGSVVNPAGTSATNPGLVRNIPKTVFPLVGSPTLVVPNPNGGGNHRGNTGGGYIYSYPVYVGAYGGSYGGSYGSVYDSSYQQAAPTGQQPQMPNITIVMPPAQPAEPAVSYDAPARPEMHVYQPAPTADDSAPEAPHYLLAFKDHTIYSAIAYWVDGDTLHYFTSGNTHNQVSVSLVDRELTARLNKDTGVEVKLPGAKQ